MNNTNNQDLILKDKSNNISCEIIKDENNEISALNCSEPVISPEVGFYISIIIYTVVLFAGIKALKNAVDGNIKDFLREKNQKSGDGSDKSFSRLAGAIGAMGLSALFIGVGYWVIYILYSGGSLDQLTGLGKYFLTGSALFAPYAFNQLKEIFN